MHVRTLISTGLSVMILMLLVSCSTTGKKELDGGDVDPTDVVNADTPTGDIRAGDTRIPDNVSPGDAAPDQVAVDVSVETFADVEPDVQSEDVAPDVAPDVGPDTEITVQPPGCCLDDEDCDLGTDAAFVCGFLPGEEMGLCLPLPQPGQCWDNDDCEPGALCDGPTFCPCGTDCGQIQAPGVCVKPVVMAGCSLDEHCLPGEQCVGEQLCIDAEAGCEPTFGKCLPAPEAGLCWESWNCVPGTVCVNPVFCQSGAYCMVEEHPGVCLDAPNECWADADCAGVIDNGKLVCTGEWVIPWWTGADYDADPDFEGECCFVKEGKCFEDDDCLAGQSCQGATYPYLGACSDDADDEIPGTCVDWAPWPEEMCLWDTDCQAGQSCIGEWVCPGMVRCLDQWFPGMCLDDPYGAQFYCYEDWQCPEDLVCGNAWVCDVLQGDMCGGAMADPGECSDGPPIGDVGDLCGQSGGDCLPDLVCCYPCGIPGCAFKCQEPCEDNEVWCADGCPMLP